MRCLRPLLIIASATAPGAGNRGRANDDRNQPPDSRNLDTSPSCRTIEQNGFRASVTSTYCQTCDLPFLPSRQKRPMELSILGIAVEQRHVVNAVWASPQRDVAALLPLFHRSPLAKRIADALS